MNELETQWMRQALKLAQEAGEMGDVPVGALVVSADGEVLGTGYNTREIAADPVGHAEVNALREAAASIGDWNLSGTTLVVTLEPCTMCAGAIANARVSRVVFGAWDEKAGAVGSVRDVLRDARLPHRVEVLAGVLADEAAEQLRTWFTQELR